MYIVPATFSVLQTMANQRLIILEWRAQIQHRAWSQLFSQTPPPLEFLADQTGCSPPRKLASLFFQRKTSDWRNIIYLWHRKEFHAGNFWSANPARLRSPVCHENETTPDSQTWNKHYDPARKPADCVKFWTVMRGTTVLFQIVIFVPPDSRDSFPILRSNSKL